MARVFSMKKSTKKIIDYLKEKLKKFLISELAKKLFGAVLGGFQGWIFEMLISKTVWPYTEQLLNKLIVKGYLAIDKIEGNIYAKRIDYAVENNDSNAYDDVLDHL